MDREQAARLLGVPEEADPGLVRRAYRTWARVAHPDVGGDPEHFALLVHARRTLLRPRATDPRPMPAPSPRAPLSAMTHLPDRWPVLAVAAVLCLACAGLPRVGAGHIGTALICGLASAAWAWWAARACLRAGADAGHRIMLLALLWLPLAAGQGAVSAMLGTAFFEMLPLLTLPFVAVVASVNAGAGLWRATR